MANLAVFMASGLPMYYLTAKSREGSLNKEIVPPQGGVRAVLSCKLNW